GEFTSPAHPGRTFVLASALAERATRLLGEGTTLVRTMPGSALVGSRYVRPLDVVPLPDEGDAQVVVPGAFVTAEDGSGLVHMAPAFGADDFAAGQAHGLAMLRP